MRCISHVLSLLVCLALGACSNTPVDGPRETYPAVFSAEQQRPPTYTRLKAHYARWRGTPYKMGGMSTTGVDCSGFVFITYRDVFGMVLPRTTDRLSDVGDAVSRREIAFGDLLVFKTGFKQKHVGIYLGEGQFIHASSSRGVMASHIQSPYWADAYREARRVIPPF